MNSDLRAVGSYEFFTRKLGSFFRGPDSEFQLNALPAKYEQLKETDNRQQSRKPDDPSIVGVFLFSLFAVSFSFFGSLWGWDNFYNGRRLFGAALIGCSGLLGGLGFFAWWGFSL